MRFRPIIMTSFAFILGDAARWCSRPGPGRPAGSRSGTAVFGGMITATVLAVFFVPVFYVAIQSLIELRTARRSPRPAATWPSRRGPPTGPGGGGQRARRQRPAEPRWRQGRGGGGGPLAPRRVAKASGGAVSPR